MKFVTTFMALILFCFSTVLAQATGLDLEKFRLATREYSFLLGLKTSGVLLSTERIPGYGSFEGEFYLRINLIRQMAANLTEQLRNFSNPYLLNELRQIIADLESAGTQQMTGGVENSVRLQKSLCKRTAERLNGLADLAEAEYQKNSNAISQFIEAAAQSPDKLTPELKRALIQATRQVEDERLVAEQTMLQLQKHLHDAESRLAEKENAIKNFDLAMSARESKQAESELALAALKQQIDQTLQKLSADQDALRTSQDRVNQALQNIEAEIAQRKTSFEAQLPDLVRAAMTFHTTGEVKTSVEGLARLDEKTDSAITRGMTAELLSRIQDFKTLRRVPVKANILVTAIVLKEDVSKKGLFVESVDRAITLALRIRVQQGIHSAEEELSQIRVSIAEKHQFSFSENSLLSLESELSQSLTRMVGDAEIAALNTQPLEDALCKILLRNEKP